MSAASTPAKPAAPDVAPAPASATPAQPALVKAAPVPFGVDSSGKPVLAPFQPTAGSLAILLTPYLRNSLDLSAALPLPKGLQLMRSPDESQIQLRAAPLFARKMRRTFGYVGDIKMTSGEGSETPSLLQVITKVPWRYGSSAAERDSSWILVRLQAFTSKALFETPARIG